MAGEMAVPSDTSARHRRTDDGERSHLADAREDLLDQWEDGRPLQGNCPIAPGDFVRIIGRDRIGTVQRTVRTSSGYRVDVSVDGQVEHASVESLQKIEGDPRAQEFWISETPATAREIAMTLTWTKIRESLSNTLYSYNASKTIFRAYQFIPALKILNSPTGRLLIADEVGLGKTIEAGLVWSELDQRLPMQRTLVVSVPSSLTLKWRAEMSRRFARELEIIKPARLTQLANDLLAGHDPELHAIISIESLRSASDALDLLTKVRPRFDLIIVDEAHSLRNTGTRSNILGGLLSDWADHLLFLSATPINLRSDDLYNLLSLLDDGLFADAEIFHLQLEPNQHLNAIGREIAGGATGSSVQHHLASLERLAFGESVVFQARLRAPAGTSAVGAILVA